MLKSLQIIDIGEKEKWHKDKIREIYAESGGRYKKSAESHKLKIGELYQQKKKYDDLLHKYEKIMKTEIYQYICDKMKYIKQTSIIQSEIERAEKSLKFTILDLIKKTIELCSYYCIVCQKYGHLGTDCPDRCVDPKHLWFDYHLKSQCDEVCKKVCKHCQQMKFECTHDESICPIKTQTTPKKLQSKIEKQITRFGKIQDYYCITCDYEAIDHYGCCPRGRIVYHSSVDFCKDCQPKFLSVLQEAKKIIDLEKFITFVWEKVKEIKK
jgi:hypothetical protein